MNGFLAFSHCLLGLLRNASSCFQMRSEVFEGWRVLCFLGVEGGVVLWPADGAARIFLVGPFRGNWGFRRFIRPEGESLVAVVFCVVGSMACWLGSGLSLATGIVGWQDAPLLGGWKMGASGLSVECSDSR